VSDYTPTTKEVRHVYRGSLVQTETNIYTFIDETQADAEFDRWLAEVKAQAITEWQLERLAAFRKATAEDNSAGENK
jgi:methyl coenzyme M reductase subunit C-like uncharacterized protein (methanogenesis marker protein 7)